TPASPMGEWADQWKDEGRRNIFGTVPTVVEMQSEGGAAGTLHGALQAGSLGTTFTASQGLLLMIPNMYKIAGELTSAVFHITARSVAAQALSIFGDHSDVMAARATGWAMLFAGSVQEAMDFALIAQASTLRTRVPFLHIFDGFRTSHEVMKIEPVREEEIRAMIDGDLVREHRRRALSPDHPVVRGTAQNPDVFFQARETVNPYYLAAPNRVQQEMERFEEITGRRYRLFDYAGDPEAERVLVLMGSGAETAEETAAYLNRQGEKVGVVKVRLYRPFSVPYFLAALPTTVRSLAVLDRTKEPGSAGEPLYQDVVTAISEGLAEGILPPGAFPRVIGGRYGLSSKEFTPAMVKAVFDELAKPCPKNHFTVGITDDVTHTSLEYDPDFTIEPDDVVRAMFWGLGSDGTVGANKNSIKIIGEETDNYAQGYFVYDSKKSGSMTVSHLRFGPRPIQSAYLIQRASFIAVHQFDFLERYPVLEKAEEGATILINSPYPPDAVWALLPAAIRHEIRVKRLKLYVLDGYAVAKATGMGVRINTIMQTGFFALSGVLPRDEAIAQIKQAIQKTYGKRGEAVVQKNYAAVDQALAHLYPVEVPATDAGLADEAPPAFVPEEAPRFVREVTAEMMAGRGDLLPVSALPDDGTYPVGTSKWEKRNIALEAPVWEPDLCIECGKCVLVCPHAVIRAKVAEEAALADAPETFKSMPAKFKEIPGQRYILQVSVEDCTGCALCVQVCPVADKTDPSRKALNMAPQRPLREPESRNWAFFQSLPDVTRDGHIHFNSIKNVQLLQPLFEFSGACSGCGETPYLKLLSQLFGERALIANATGCSSIYGGNLPTTPWTCNREGRGPAWSNSLFEDNAEFGLGMRLTLNQQTAYARRLVEAMREEIGKELAEELLASQSSGDEEIAAQRERVAALKSRLEGRCEPWAKDLLTLADVLVPRSVWIVGGDGWAYDIDYGGLDHVLATGHNVNLLVLDTEVYSNTGGQASKATFRGAVAKFAAAGKPRPKKDLGRMVMSYGNVYVAQVAMGANDQHVVKTFLEAEAYDGPSLIIAYGHCIAHGIDMINGLTQQKRAVESGYWPLYRYHPDRIKEGKNPFQLDCKEPSLPLEDYIYTETRYQSLRKADPEHARILLEEAQEDVRNRFRLYQQMAAAPAGTGG
ncbi:MAG TPA: pyruvate:ferredoxin (flavodoxin) oxidoreductase, partial [Chthonomonadaceae bacterium]|nr:pyruvate:ferredoxin (flavodoxin) oxidoreductase [Chthonomonadaceae bacterium]